MPKIVTNFVNLDEMAALTAEADTAASDLPLPTSLTATVDGVETSIYGVTWVCGTYDPLTPGAYTFTTALPDGYALADGVIPPTLVVTVLGAAAAQAMTPQVDTLVVTTTADSGPGSLREAILAANASPGSEITFDQTVFAMAQTIQLVTSLPNIAVDVTLRGNGADKTIVQAPVGFPHLYVLTGVTARFESMTFLGPGELQPQGGISGSVRGNADSVMEFESCAIKGGVVGYFNGGGIDTEGTLFMTGCEISGNRSQSGDGGGIAAETLTLVDCTVSRNQGGSQGGGVAARTSATLINCTVTGNVAHDVGSAGGVGVATNGSLTMYGTVVSGNYLDDAAQTQSEVVLEGVRENGNGTVTSAFGGYNIIGIPGVKTLADLQTLMQAEAMELDGKTYAVGKLQNNGGFTQTVMPTVGSAALDAIPLADYSGWFTPGPAPTADGRGFARPDASNAGLVDIGAVEAQQVASISITNAPATLNMGQTLMLAYATTPASPEAWDGAVTWSSGAPSVLAIDPQTGALTPLKPGTATIAVTTSVGITGSVSVTVAPVLYEFTAAFPIVTDALQPINGTTNGPFSKFTGLQVDGNTLTQGTDYTAADGSTVVTLLPLFLKTLRKGTHDVIATYSDGTAHTTLEVDISPVVHVTGVTLNVPNTTVAVGGMVRLTPTITPNNATNMAVTWASSDSSVAPVDENGLVTGVKPGQVSITVTTTDGGFTASCIVTVTAATTSLNPGDETSPWLWLALAAVSGAALLLVLYMRRKRARGPKGEST